MPTVGDFVINEGNKIGKRVQLQEAVDGRFDLVKSGLLLPYGVRYRLNFWEGFENVVFPEVNCTGYHAEGGRQVRGCGGIVPFAGKSYDAKDLRVGGRNGGASVTVDEAFEKS